MTIPDDVMKTATAAWLAGSAMAIARAIMAERERCARVAETVDLFDGDFLKNSDPRVTVAAAIRRGHTKQEAER